MKKIKLKLTPSMAQYLAFIAKNSIETDRVTSLVVGKLLDQKDHLRSMVILLCEGVFRSIYVKVISKGTLKSLSLSKAELIAMHWLFLNTEPGNDTSGNYELLGLFDQAILAI